MVDFEPWGPVDDLVVAAGGRHEQVAQAIARAGPATVAALLAAEVALRGTAPPGADATVNLAMTHGGATYRYVVTLAEGAVAVADGSDGDAWADVTFDLADLACSLYAPRPGLEPASRAVEVRRWPWTREVGELSTDELDAMVRRGEADPEQLSVEAHAHFAALFRVVHAVLDACSAGTATLSDLAAAHGSDKWGGLHWYTPHYERHLGGLRHQPVTVLEIGIGGYRWESLGGDSLYTWQRWFPRGLVVGLDVHAKPLVRGPRVRTVQGDQGDPAFLDELGRRVGPFDVVVDDGSHLNEHVRTSFSALWPHVRPGGHYVIEDLHTAYWPELGGDAPPGTSGTSMGLLKDLLDDVQASEWAEPAPNGAPSRPGAPTDVSVHHNLAFLRKGASHERGVPAWVRRRATRGRAGGTAPRPTTPRPTTPRPTTPRPAADVTREGTR